MRLSSAPNVSIVKITTLRVFWNHNLSAAIEWFFASKFSLFLTFAFCFIPSWIDVLRKSFVNRTQISENEINEYINWYLSRIEKWIQTICTLSKKKRKKSGITLRYRLTSKRVQTKNNNKAKIANLWQWHTLILMSYTITSIEMKQPI